MTSQINPNNIDTSYPVAGQDNNTQGFRSNFSGIKQNFTYAYNEISALQNNAILTSVSSTDLKAVNLANCVIQDFTYRNLDIGNIVAANVANVAVANINFKSGSFQTLTLGSNADVNIFGLPAGNTSAVLTLEINSTAATANGVPFYANIPNLSTGTQNSGLIGVIGNTLNFPRTNSTNAGTHVYQLVTNDQGATWTATALSSTMNPLNASSEDLAASASVNLGVSDSYFSTSGAETATLPAGVNGQVKVLAMYADGGDMVVTVANAGWKTSGTGTVTFDTIGDACTLKYINSKWFCIGNNGCTFA